MNNKEDKKSKIKYKLADRNNTIIILATGTGGYTGEGFKSEGYKVYAAYKPASLLQRISREIFFRIPFLPKSIWYEKDILNETAEFIIVRDSLIIKNYLVWLKKHFPNAQINFLYENMIGKSRHLRPDELPDFVRKWTYDEYDSRKYGIPFHNAPYYFKKYIKDTKPKKYDLLFVGEDKGRAEYVLNLKKFLEENGCVIKVHIVAESRLDKKKTFYQQRVSYNQITEWISESRAILNMALENQEGITVRDMESIFNHVKLVTTNEHIKNTKIYNENNVFLLDKNNWSDLVEFLKTDYEEDINIRLEDYSSDHMVEVVTGKQYEISTESNNSDGNL